MTALSSVGRIYDVAINGVGYMLHQKPDDQELSRRRLNSNLEAPRQLGTDTPFADQFDRYRFVGFYDWRGGMGQSYYDRPDSDPTKYSDSSGVDPFTDAYKLSLLHATSQKISGGYANATVAGSKLYYVVDENTIKYFSTLAGAVSSFDIANITGGAGISGVTSDGVYWYACTGDSVSTTAEGVYRNNVAADPGARWSSIKLESMSWEAQRICGIRRVGGNYIFTTLTSAGVEEVGGGRITLPSSYTVPLGANVITGGGGFVWFVANTLPAGSVGSTTAAAQIYKWDLTTATPSSACAMPVGDQLAGVYYYQGNVFVMSWRPTDDVGTAKATVWRATVDSSGNLDLTRICDFGGDVPTVNSASGVFGAYGTLVYFGWYGMGANTTTTGIGAIDLASGGYARWLVTSALGFVVSIVPFHGHIHIGILSQGLYQEQDTYVSTGNLFTSYTDANSGLTKVWDQATLTLDGDTTGAVRADVSFDTATLTTILSGVASNGATSAYVDQNGVRALLELVLTSGSSGTATPVVRLAQLKYHAKTVSDVVLRLPIDCGDRVRDLRGKDLTENGTGAGNLRARTLEALIGSTVEVQDIDYAQTGTASNFDVVSVDRRALSLWDRQQGKSEIREVALVTLRQRV